MKYLTLIILGIFILINKSSLSQAITASNCDQAINICSNAAFQIDPNGVGSVNEIPTTNSTSNPSINPASLNSGCLLTGESNSTWMIVNIQTAGTLEFSFGGGGAQAGYYDWAMWPYTPTSCAGIQGNTLPPIRCNWNSQSTGGTGIANSLPAGAAAGNFEPALAVSCGQKFVICFSNYSGAATTVPLDFFGSAVVSCAPIPNPITVTNAAICSGQTANLTASGAAGNTYTWTPGGSTGSSLSVSPTTTTTYTVSGSGGCGSMVGTQTTVVTVTGGPNSTISSVTNSAPGGGSDPSPAVQCLTPNSFNFNAPTVTGTHSWNFGGGGATPSTSSSNSPTGIVYSVPGTYTVSHSVNNGGCISTSTTVVTVNPMPTSVVSSNPVCGTTNSANVVVSGGTAGYTYNWLPSGGTGISATGLAPGVYSVTATDASGCIVTNTVQVVTNPSPSATLSYTNPNCGASNGIIVINNTSGAQTISSFASSIGSVSGQTVTGLGAGTPVITLTNSFGCTFTVSTTLSTTSGPSAITTSVTNATCGNSNGSFTFGTPTGGTAPYTYSVNNVSATSPSTGLGVGTYTVAVRDFNGCVFTKTVAVINIPGPTAISGTTTPAGCSLSNGTYNITGVTGGTAPYSYSVDAVATSSLTGSLASGTHTVSVVDFNGCAFNTTLAINQTTGPTSATISAGLATCGSANGTATVIGVTGGTPTYSFSFDGGAFTASNNTGGLAANAHTVVVKDANSCTLTVNYNVLNNGSPTATVTGFTNPLCSGGSTGSFSVSASGGSGAPFSYTLTAPFQTNTTGVFSSLPAGPYNLSIKDASGCTTVASVTLTNPPPVVITATALPAKCFGTSTGTISVTGSGGTPTYSYNLNGGGYQLSSTFPNQSASTYVIGIKDGNGCLLTQTVTVTQPTALAINVSTQSANCTSANGIASSTVTGGTGAITYAWTGGGGAGSVSNGLVGGTYTVTATDANGCVISSAAVIGITPGGAAAITASSNITCFNANNGSLTTGMTGGTSPFNYSWTPGGQTTQSATGLAPGTFTCTVTDFYGCQATAMATLTQPTQLTAIMNSNNVKCYGTATGTVSAAGTGGTGPYTYLWPSIPSTLSTVSNIGIGNYTCNITDNNNCTITATINVTQPTSITLTSTVTSANCNQANGSATVIASGGAPGAYTYTWSSGSNAANQSGLLAGTYTIQVQDANNCTEIVSATIPNTAGPVISISSQTNVSCFGACNGVATASVTGGVTPYIYSWSNGNVSAVAPNLCAQIYTVSVTDDAGCVASTSVTITQPTQLTVGIVANDPKCFGATNGFGIASALGGTSGYTYAWSGGGGSSSTSAPLGAGGYNLLVTDGNGCTVTTTMTLNNPPAMAASITATNVSCFGTCNGIAIATSTNGIGAVGYSWVGGASPVFSQTASSLCAGTYTMVATDQNSCTASAIITITQPPVLTASISSTGSVTCNGGSNGFAVVSAGGGTPGYSYVWSGAASAAGNSSNANSLPAGVYPVTVTDTKSCSVTTNATIIEPAAFATTLTTTDAKCNGVCDGTANIAFSGGAGTTTFLWQPGLQSGNFVNNLCAGGQTVTITSNGSCPTVLTFTLTEPALLTAVASATNSNCGQANGKTCALVAGGTSPLVYAWSNSINTLCNNNVVAGAYTFTVTDFNGCTAIASGLVNDVAGPVVVVTSQTNVSCFGGTNGAALATINGGVPSYTISWSGTQSSANTTLNPINFGAGLHNITVVDAAGCVGSASVNISEPTQLVSAIGSFTNVSCNGLSNGGATVLVNGGTTPYSYTWTPSAQTSSVLANVPVNSYTALVSDGNGCLTSSQVVISQPQALILASSSFSNISCFGGSNGQISTTVQGGTPGYTYVWNPAQAGNSGVIGSLAAGGYSLTVTDSKTCSINANFTILEPSQLTSSYVSSPAKCGLTNGSATVAIGGGTPSYTLNWNTAPAQQGSIATNMAPGSNWQCVITDLNGCSITQTVNVNNAPSPIFSSPVVTQPSCFGLCNGDITVNYTSGTGPYTVIWSSPISQTTTSVGLTQNVAGICSGAYSATLTDVNGCATSQQISVSQPGKLVLIVSPDVTICYGQSTQLNASGQNGSPAYSYTWTPNPFVGGGPHTVSPTAMTSYNVMVSDTKGCSDGPKVITINVTPQLSVTGSSVTLCHNGTAVLAPNMTSPGNGGAYTYTWTPAAGNVSSITYTGSAAVPGTATTNTIGLIVSDGCTVPNASAIFTVVTNPLPNINFSGNPLQGCAPLTVTLTGTSDGASDVFSWSDNVTHVTNSGNPLPMVFADSGKYSITLVVQNPLTGCINTLAKNNYIEVYPQPIASFYANPPSTSIIDPNIDFVNTSQGATSYLWDFGDPVAINGSNNSTAVNPSHGYSYTGEYAVNLIATSPKGCKDIARILVNITPEFALYIPNAFTPDENGNNDIFQPLGIGIDEENYRLDIFDRWGENIFTSNNFRKGWDGSVKGSSKAAPQGVYIYKLLVTDTQGAKHPYVGHVTVIRKNQ